MAMKDWISLSDRFPGLNPIEKDYIDKHEMNISHNIYNEVRRLQKDPSTINVNLYMEEKCIIIHNRDHTPIEGARVINI
jgi:hypothetical protein